MHVGIVSSECCGFSAVGLAAESPVSSRSLFCFHAGCD